MPLTLMYHDVVEPGRDDASGFPGPPAARYKLSRAAFVAHLDAIAANAPRVVATLDRQPGRDGTPPPLLLTFDDGGSSAAEYIAGELERRGWLGWFFITTDRIGTPGFVTPEQIRALHDRGHVIGTHSCSHPARISALGRDDLLREWQTSRAVLAEIVGAPVVVGSVPGGFYSRQVAEAAADAGLTLLFNSEPTTRLGNVAGCTIAGRYTIFRGTPATVAAALANRQPLPRVGQAVAWNLKKLAKNAAGPLYQNLRSRLLVERAS